MENNTSSTNIIELKHITKTFEDGFVAVEDFNLTVKRGEFVTFLGPSGCGKTTTLRMIAGFEIPTEGEILLDGKEIGNLPPNKRPINTVFQRYALFPHLNIFDNIAFGLKLKKLSKDEIKRKVKKVLEMVDLEGFETRKVATLSGGQQQRIAIARALVNEPQILLLDEPLGALDLKMRKEMQLELKSMHERLGITFIYITHDQEEAINMSDRIVVMNQGRFEQTGTPDEIYNHPKTSYVATFVGNANILKGKAAGINGPFVQVKIGSEIASIYTDEKVKAGNEITFAVRSENIVLDENEMGSAKYLHATVKEKNFAAGQLRVLLVLSDGTEITASRFGMNANIQPGQKISWYFDPKNAVVVDKDAPKPEFTNTTGGNP